MSKKMILSTYQPREEIFQCYVDEYGEEQALKLFNDGDYIELEDLIWDNNYRDAKELLFQIDFPDDILIIASLGLWNGDRIGIGTFYEKSLDEVIFKHILNNSDYDDFEIYGENNNLHVHAYHHDGINRFILRKWKENISDNSKDKLQNDIMKEGYFKYLNQKEKPKYWKRYLRYTSPIKIGRY